MGDSTFFHSGMTGAAEIIYNNGRMIPVRAGQLHHRHDRPSGEPRHRLHPAGRLEAHADRGVLAAMGFPNVMTVDPQDLTAMKETVDRAWPLAG